MRIIDADTVHRLLPYPALIDWLEQAHRLPPPQAERSVLIDAAGRPEGEGIINLTAWAPGRAFGIKTATLMPGNAGGALPTIQSVVLLFDGTDGRPLAQIDGTAETLRKTAADSGLGSRLLSRPDARTLLLIGAGALGPHLVAAHRAARPSLDRVLVWNRTAGPRDRLVADLREDGVAAEAVDDSDRALAEADVISVATRATAPLVAGERLKPGSHVDLVGAFTPDMRESDDAVMRRGRLYVDYRGSTVGHVGDLTQPMAAGVITDADLLGDLFDLCTGRAGARTSPDQITVYKNGGGGHLDLFAAECLVQAAGRQSE